MAGKVPPARQNMINMMYLVLTALLALNVSKEILEAFVLIDESLEMTTENFVGKNEITYSAFERALQNDPGKVKPYYDKAMQAKAYADEMITYIDDLKKYLFQKVDNLDESVLDTFKLKYCNSLDNHDIQPGIMIGDPGSPKTGERSAAELKAKLNKLKEQFIGLLDPKIRGSVEVPINTKDVGLVNGTFETWETGNFFGLPFAAVITNLSKIQADVRNAESDITTRIYSNISAEDFKFDTLAARVIPNTNYVIIGDTYRADVFVAAFSTTQNPVLTIGKTDSTGNFTPSPDSGGVSYDRGVARYAIAPNTEGEHEWGGVIKVKKPDGSYSPYPFHSSFFAAKPTLVVSPTAMNVFYRGIDNPVEVSVPGIPTELLEVSISNASRSGSGGKYKVRPGKGKTSTVSVSATVNGQKRNFGKMEFRVKNVPDPKPSFAGITASGRLAKNKLKVARGVLAKMENFEFDLKFRVISFTMSATIKGKVVELKAGNAAVTHDMKTLVNALRSKQKLYIENIKAKGPDGTVRNLGTIVIKVI